jgi:hypothetical protein
MGAAERMKHLFAKADQTRGNKLSGTGNGIACRVADFFGGIQRLLHTKGDVA